MKKIVFVCDGNNFSGAVFRFVNSLYENEPFLLAGGFFFFINYWLLITKTIAPDAGPYMAYTEEENEAYHQGIQKFKHLCEKNNIEYRVHEQGDVWDISDLEKESRFADLIVVGGAQFFSDASESEAKTVLQET